MLVVKGEACERLVRGCKPLTSLAPASHQPRTGSSQRVVEVFGGFCKPGAIANSNTDTNTNSRRLPCASIARGLCKGSSDRGSDRLPSKGCQSLLDAPRVYQKFSGLQRHPSQASAWERLGERLVRGW